LICPDYQKSLQHGDVEIFFKPMTYQDMNENNKLQFQYQKTMAILPSSDMPEEEKLKVLSDSMKEITLLTVKALTHSIAAVRTPSALVTEPMFFEEFLMNCERNLFSEVRDKILSLKSESEIKPMTLICDECHKSYDQSVTLDMTSFFAAAS
jgi:hypothetical protein